MRIVLPIIIEESGTLILYNSIDDAEHHLESYDVDDALYRGWDAEGRSLNISSDNNKIAINANDSEPDFVNTNALEQVLRDHLGAVGINAGNISNGDLASLIKEARFFLYIPKSKKQVIKELFSDLFSAIKGR
jgi:hypothetical protein